MQQYKRPKNLRQTRFVFFSTPTFTRERENRLDTHQEKVVAGSRREFVKRSHKKCFPTLTVIAVEGPVSTISFPYAGPISSYCAYAYALLTPMLAKERKRKLRSLRFFADGRSLANLVSGVFFLWGSLGY